MKKQTTQTQEKTKTYAARIESGDSILQALKSTKESRKILLNTTYKRKDFLQAVQDIANRLGFSRVSYDIRASYPLKSDIARISTIKPFENKKRDIASPRMVAALILAKKNCKGDSFDRVFHNGLFLENGVLTDLLTGGFLTCKGENEKQAFTFTKKANIILTRKEVQDVL